MEQTMISLGLDIVIAVLLCTTIIYAFLLNKKLQNLRADRAEMENLTRKFFDATTKAENGVKTLKASSGDLQRDVQATIDKARLLRDELTFILERGELLASQLEGSISGARPEKPSSDLAALLQKAADNADKGRKNRELQNLQDIFDDQGGGDARSAAEQELLKALKGVR